jgi:hypothetical protein
MGEGRDVSVSKCRDSMSNRSRLTTLMGFLGVLEGLARVLVSGQVILLPLLLRNPMGMRGTVV